MTPEQLLETHLGRSGWQLRNPPAGLSKPCYIAQCADRIVFLKVDVNAAYLHRLSELGITPPVLASGFADGTSFVIQEYCPGVHPAAKWFHDHLDQVAHLMNTYHRDEMLASLLQADHRISTAADAIATLAEEIGKLRNSPQKQAVLDTFRDLERQHDPVNSILVPIHADPNHKNFLVDGGNVRIVDWDDIALSDPLRDTALICYWYLPENQWPDLLEKLGLGCTHQIVDRLYWWVALRSLQVCLWFGAKGQDHEMASFLEDARAASARHPNPHAAS